MAQLNDLIVLGNTSLIGSIKANSDHDLLARSNEFNFASPKFRGDLYINYRTASGSDGVINSYRFCKGAGNALSNIYASTFYGALSGNATSASAVNVATINSNGTYYLLSATGVTGNLGGKAVADTYYYYGTTYSSLNVGKTTKNGILTLWKNNFNTDIQSSATAARTITLPDMTGDIALSTPVTCTMTGNGSITYNSATKSYSYSRKRTVDSSSEATSFLQTQKNNALDDVRDLAYNEYITLVNNHASGNFDFVKSFSYGDDSIEDSSTVIRNSDGTFIATATYKIYYKATIVTGYKCQISNTINTNTSFLLKLPCKLNLIATFYIKDTQLTFKDFYGNKPSDYAANDILYCYRDGTTIKILTKQGLKRIGYNAATKYYLMATSDISHLESATCSNSVYLKNNVLYGAAWNDYAEYREVKEKVKPGTVVIENGDGILIPSTDRLQPGGNIVSDTYGFIIGQTKKCNTPLAVSGRVLAYPFEEKEKYLPGDAVCTGPGGTVSKMTREEIKEYPERIIGTVSEIPNYEYWGIGNVKVDNRIWIKVK